MAIKIKELVAKLQEKDQEAKVEFFVAETNGRLVCVDIKTTIKSMRKLLNTFDFVEKE